MNIENTIKNFCSFKAIFNQPMESYEPHYFLKTKWNYYITVYGPVNFILANLELRLF